MEIEQGQERTLAKHFGELKRSDFRDFKKHTNVPVRKQTLTLSNKAKKEAKKYACGKEQGA